MNTAQFIHTIYTEYLEKASIILSDIELENHNKEYHGALFKLNKQTVRFRKAKHTPTKAGLFVVAWQKDVNNKNEAYSYDKAPEYMMVYCENKMEHGLFLFPKNVLLEHKILSTNEQKGKMGFRVYPPCEINLNKQASKTQIWQSAYYIRLSNSYTKLSEANDITYLEKILNPVSNE